MSESTSTNNKLTDPDQSSAPEASPGSTNGSSDKNGKEMNKLFRAMKENDASDLHLKAGQPPLFRISTDLKEVGSQPLDPEDVKRLARSIMTDEQVENFEEKGDIDFAYGLPGVGRFRVNVFRQRGSISAAIRRISSEIPSLEELHLPSAIKKISTMNQGLVLFVGQTGQGKSTSIASLLNCINKNRKEHIITLEDPIEYLIQDEKSIVNQREIGIDVENFEVALKRVVRQDPDVILLGELRDRESFDAGLMAAETGHLVFGTLHASSAPGTIGRILDLFPSERESQIRQLLRFNLKAVVAQKLLPSSHKQFDLVPAVEIMFVNSMIRKLIKERDDKEIHKVIKGGDDNDMQDFNQSIKKLLDQGYITKEVALKHSPNPEQLKMKLRGIDLGQDKSILGES